MIGTSFKYYIFPQNTPWGVIRKADGALVYKHVINFPNIELREQFVNRYLNNSRNYKQDLENSKARAFDFLSDTRIHFRKNVGNDLNRFSNADFMVVKIGGVEKFYALKVLKIQGQIIDYEGELDIFFTYKMRVRENTQNPVFRAHLNRLVEDGTRFKLPNVTEFPELNFGREIDLPLLKTGLKNWDDIESEDFINFPKNIKWLTIFYQPNENGTQMELFGRLTFPPYNYQLKYKIGMIPVHFVYHEDGRFNIKEIQGGTQRENLGVFTFNFELDNPAILGIYLSDKPFYSFRKENWEWEYDSILNEYSLKSSNNFSQELLLARGFHFQGIEERITSLHLDLFYLIGPKKQSQHFFPQEKISDFNQKDPKFFSSQYFKLVFTSNINQTLQEYSLYNSLISKNEKTGIWINQIPSINLADLSQSYFLESLVENNLISKKIFVDNEIAEVPTSIDKWKEYYIQNKNAIQANKIRAASSLGTGILSVMLAAIAAVTAPITGGSSLVALGAAGAAIAGVSQIATFGNTINTINSTEKDLKNQLDTQKQTNSGLMGRFFTEFDSTIHFYTLSLDEVNSKKLENYLKRYGYNYGGNLANVNQFLENRFYWNFIMANDVFNTIDLQLSSPIKQIIGQAFQDGITFWHYRGGEFGGVLNYENDNREQNWNIPSLRAKKNDKKISQKRKKLSE